MEKEAQPLDSNDNIKKNSTYEDRQKKYYDSKKDSLAFKLKRKEQQRRYYLKKREKQKNDVNHKKLVFTNKICTYCGKTLIRRQNSSIDFEKRTMHVKCFNKYKAKLYNDLKKKYEDKCQQIKDLNLL